jgi:hypothetical protein
MRSPASVSLFARSQLGLALAAAAALTFAAACGGAEDSSPAGDGTVAFIEGEGVSLVAAGPVVAPVIDIAAVDEAPPDETPPGLVVVSPVPGSSVTDTNYVFQGFSEPGATVTVDNISTVANEAGRWSVSIVLEEGENEHKVTATDESGNTFEKEFTVNCEKKKPEVVYEPPKKEETHKDEPKPAAEEEKPHKEASYEFTAWVKFGVCQEHPLEQVGGGGGGKDADDELLTKFKGSGVPGTLVTVTSPFGGGSTEVGSDGYWYIKVQFEPGAAEDDFTALVTNGDHRARFKCGIY